MSEKYIVIGDIHGCSDQLDEILDMTAQYSDHKYVFLGDYIDRGPDSEAVINRIRELDAIFLKGNHEEMFLGHLEHYEGETLEDMLASSGLSQISIEWISHHLLEVYESDRYIFVHAGLSPKRKMSEQTTRYFLWSRFDGDYSSITNKTVIHGHTVVSKPEIVGNRININTGCGSRGTLTALVLPEMKYYSSSVSPGVDVDWEKLRMELEEELLEYEQFGELEPVDD